MNKQIKQNWIELLRSGKYEQSFTSLKENEFTYSAEGLLCLLHSLETNTEWTQDNKYLNRSVTIPRQVLDWAGVNSNAIFVKYQVVLSNGKTHILEDSTFVLNNVGYDFDLIADVLEIGEVVEDES